MRLPKTKSNVLCCIGGKAYTFGRASRHFREIATRAIEALVVLAFKSSEVLAKVRERNAPSTRVVQKLGFVSVGTEVDPNKGVLARWILRAQSNPSFKSAPHPGTT